MSGIVQGIAAPAADAAPQATSEQPNVVTPITADPKLEIYARKEKALMKMRREFEEQKKAWEAEKANYLPKNRFKEDPMSALAEVDLDYSKLTETVLNQPNINDPTIRALQNRLNKMEQAETDRARAAQETQAVQYEQTKRQMLNDVKLATNGAADYELIEKWAAHDLVVERIENAFNEDGIVMDTITACKAVEEYLLNEALKVYETTKIKERLKPKEQEVAPKPAAETAAAKKWQSQDIIVTPRNINTLTNRLSQETPKRSSDMERRARAIATLKGELK